MGKLKIFVSALLISLVSAVSASANVVSFQIIQHDPGQEKVRASSYVIESRLFDFFFEKGIVITNSPTAVSSSGEKDEELYYEALSEASSGFCNYFISITIDYKTQNSTNPDALILSNIEKINWKVFDLKTGKSVASGSRIAKEVKSNKDNEKGISEFTVQVAQDIYGSLKKL